MGSEEDGISIELIALSDKVAFVPMHGQIGSLNVAAATAIFLYEAARQRTK
jgi:23S rRNA (guanosine2251-2'-O)-methyltransferase